MLQRSGKRVFRELPHEMRWWEQWAREKKSVCGSCMNIHISCANTVFHRFSRNIMATQLWLRRLNRTQIKQLYEFRATTTKKRWKTGGQFPFWNSLNQKFFRDDSKICPTNVNEHASKNVGKSVEFGIFISHITTNALWWNVKWYLLTGCPTESNEIISLNFFFPAHSRVIASFFTMNSISEWKKIGIGK